jgi:hypothetical protein
MTRLVAAALALGLGLGSGLGPAAQAQDFSLYRGSEARLAFGQIRDLPDLDSLDALTLDTRHRLWIAPFLGAQIDLGAARVDRSENVYSAGLHLHAMPEGGNRYGVFYLPLWDDRFDDRVDNYGAEAMISALPALTVEARVGRFSGDALQGPYVGSVGYYALSPQLTLLGGVEHTRLDFFGGDVRSTDASVGAEYDLPGTGVRLRGATGFTRYAGDVDSTTVFRASFGATLVAIGEPGATARTRTFGRQSLLGLF